MQTNIYISLNIIAKTLFMELSRNCVLNSSGVIWLPQNVGSKIKRKHQIWPDIHKTNGAIVSVSLVLCKFICQT